MWPPGGCLGDWCGIRAAACTGLVFSWTLVQINLRQDVSNNNNPTKTQPPRVPHCEQDFVSGTLGC